MTFPFKTHSTSVNEVEIIIKKALQHDYNLKLPVTFKIKAMISPRQFKKKLTREFLKKGIKCHDNK